MAISAPELVERNRDRIRECEEIDDEERANILSMSKEMGRNRSEWGDERHASVLQRLIILSWGGQKYDAETHHGQRLTDALDDKEVAGQMVDWIERTYDSEETKLHMRNAIRTFGKILRNDDPTAKDAEPPDAIAWMSSTTPSSYNPRPNPGDMITWKEVREMSDHPRTNPRDAALLAVAWDAGLRSGELQNLKIGDVLDLEAGKKLRVDGKTGPREVAITNAVPYLQQWLNQHPAPDDRRAPVWSKLKENESISYRLFRKIFAKAARRIDLQKPDTPTNFRKSSISDLASKGINQATLEDRYGWERGSKAAARYVAVFSENRQQQVLEARGADVEIEEPDPTGPKQCIRCSELIDREAEECYNCGALQDPEAAQHAIGGFRGDLGEFIGDAVREEVEEALQEQAMPLLVPLVAETIQAMNSRTQGQSFGGSGLDAEELRRRVDAGELEGLSPP